jgi:hypothetical protein
MDSVLNLATLASLDRLGKGQLMSQSLSSNADLQLHIAQYPNLALD